MGAPASHPRDTRARGLTLAIPRKTSRRSSPTASRRRSSEAPPRWEGPSPLRLYRHGAIGHRGQTPGAPCRRTGSASHPPAFGAVSAKCRPPPTQPRGLSRAAAGRYRALVCPPPPSSAGGRRVQGTLRDFFLNAAGLTPPSPCEGTNGPGRRVPHPPPTAPLPRAGCRIARRVPVGRLLEIISPFKALDPPALTPAGWMGEGTRTTNGKESPCLTTIRLRDTRLR